MAITVYEALELDILKGFKVIAGKKGLSNKITHVAVWDYETGDVIGTYVYRVGLGQQDYSFSTAVGLFDSVIGFILVMGGNFISKKSTDRSVW